MQDVPLFPFGYGLSYTTFGYGKTVLDKNELTAGQSLKLTVPVTNTGKRNGEEVVQVYLRKQGDADLSKPCVLSSVYLFRQERPSMWSLT